MIPVDDSLLPTTMSIVFQHINISSIPHESYPDWCSDDSHPGRFTVSALDILAHRLTHGLLDKSSMRALSKRNLHKLGPLIPFLRHRMERGRQSPGEWKLQEGLHNSMTLMFDVFFREEEFKSTLLSSFPEIWEELTQIWVLEQHMRPIFSAAMLLAAILDDIDDWDDTLLIVWVFIFPFLPSGDESQPSTFLLSTMLTILDIRRPGISDLYSLDAYITLMQQIAKVSCRIADALCSAGSVTIISHIARRFSSHKALSEPDSSRADLNSRIFISCLKYLLECIEFGGHKQVTDALDNQIILSMMKHRSSQPRLHHEWKEETYERILLEMEPYLLYPSILHLAAKSLRSVNKLQLTNSPSNLEITDSSSLIDPFTRFRSLVEAAKVSKLKISKTTSSNWAHCHNENHPHSDSESSKLRACSACVRVFYCSEQCQAEDWPCHRRRCRRPQRPWEEISRPDLTFVIQRMNLDTRLARADNPLQPSSFARIPKSTPEDSSCYWITAKPQRRYPFSQRKCSGIPNTTIRIRRRTYSRRNSSKLMRGWDTLFCGWLTAMDASGETSISITFRMGGNACVALVFRSHRVLLLSLS
ncbi:hypothetical protein C8J56DRAFT_360944 [Mycena floridula]|nr:hypothetical protein C8J56DRAFT_360944 [Mycena floridula]